jgi:hypothetical protein
MGSLIYVYLIISYDDSYNVTFKLNLEQLL